jgi:hypothetical protein
VIEDVVIWLWKRWGNVVVWRRWWWWVCIEVLLPLIRRRVLPLLLLTEDINGVLQFCQPCVLPVYVLPLSLSALDGCLSSHDGLLLLSKPLYLLLDPGKFIFLSLSFIFFCFIPILDFDLVELGFALDNLRWQRWRRRVGIEVLVTSAGLTGTYCGDRYVGFL